MQLYLEVGKMGLEAVGLVALGRVLVLGNDLQRAQHHVVQQYPRNGGLCESERRDMDRSGPHTSMMLAVRGTT